MNFIDEAYQRISELKLKLQRKEEKGYSNYSTVSGSNEFNYANEPNSITNGTLEFV